MARLSSDGLPSVFWMSSIVIEILVLYYSRDGSTMKMAQHPNLIRLFDIFETSTHYYIVIELCLGGDLYDYLAVRDFRIPE